MKNRFFFVPILLLMFSLSAYSQTWDGNNTLYYWGAIGQNIDYANQFTINNQWSLNGLKVTSSYVPLSGSVYGIYSDMSSVEHSPGIRYAIYGKSNSNFDYAIYSKGKMGIAGDLERVSGLDNNNWTQHMGWQVGDYTYVITPRDASGNHLFSRSLKLLRTGEMIKYVDNSTVAAFAVNKNGQNKFEVRGSGKVFATEIEVTLPPFGDYVFESSYDLLSIDEVKTYIQKNGHLPNIPSADEIEKENIGLGELAVLEMVKIEELTLYIIELNERLVNLEDENRKLNVELQVLNELIEK